MHKPVLVVTDGTYFRAFAGGRRLRPTLIKSGKDTSHGNPYNIYGNELQEWLGINKFHMDISVAHLSSGNL